MRNKNLVTILFLVIVTSVFCSCISKQNQLKDTGFFKEHQLKRFERFSSNSGQVNGGLFFGLSGSMKTEQMLQFWWETKENEMIATSAPVSKFKFIIDESKKIPTITFIFNKDWLEYLVLKGNNIYMPREDFNFNDFMNETCVFVVRISSETLEKEIYLPRK